MDPVIQFGEMLLKFVQDTGIWITLGGFIIARIIAFKRNILQKIQREMGKGKLITALMIFTELLNELDIDNLYELILVFKEKYSLEKDMKESLMDLSSLLSIKKSIEMPSVQELLEKYKKRKDSKIVLLKNKKHWNRIRNDPVVDKALNSIMNIMHEKLKMRALSIKEQANVEKINAMISSMKSNIPRNRKLRKEIETLNDDIKEKERIGELDKIKKRLYRIFRGKSL